MGEPGALGNPRPAAPSLRERFPSLPAGPGPQRCAHAPGERRDVTAGLAGKGARAAGPCAVDLLKNYG